MLRSLFTGISGLRSHQTMMDVTGNNIANVNTTGFKGSNIIFQDTLSQLQTAAGAPTLGGAGGTNPAQVGLGVEVAGITTNFGQGPAQNTGRALDFMITGDGFFTVREGNEELFTRAGAFNVDGAGQLVTTGGAVVRGWMEPNGPGDATEDLRLTLNQIDPLNPARGVLQAFTVGPDGAITGRYEDGNQYPIGQIALATFDNPSGLDKAGGSLYRPTVNSGGAQIGAAGDGALGTLSGGRLEMSNVDLAQEFTNLIIAQRGFQANSRIITTSDELLQELVNLKR